MQARLTVALAESESLVATNRKLIKEEAEARTAAERARYEAAAATASCEHAVQDRHILEERLKVVQQRATQADAAHEQSAKQLRVCTLRPAAGSPKLRRYRWDRFVPTTCISAAR